MPNYVDLTDDGFCIFYNYMDILVTPSTINPLGNKFVMYISFKPLTAFI